MKLLPILFACCLAVLTDIGMLAWVNAQAVAPPIYQSSTGATQVAAGAGRTVIPNLTGHGTCGLEFIGNTSGVSLTIPVDATLNSVGISGAIISPSLHDANGNVIANPVVISGTTPVVAYMTCSGFSQIGYGRVSNVTGTGTAAWYAFASQGTDTYLGFAAKFATLVSCQNMAVCTTPTPGQVTLNVPTPVAGTCISESGTSPVTINVHGVGCTPGPGGTPAAGTCIGITTPPAQGTVAYTCSTPYPTPTASATAGACGTAVSASGLVITVPQCTNANSPNYLTLLKAETSLTHCWFCGTTDAAGCGTAHDYVADGGYATAVPSAVPLPTFTASPTPTAPAISPTPNCAAPGIVKDGNHAVAIFNRAGGGECTAFTWPLASEPTTAPWTIEVLAAPTAQIPWDSGQEWVWNRGNTGTFDAMYFTTYLLHDQWDGGTSSNDIVGRVLPFVHIALEWDGTNHIDYVNGTMVYKDTTTQSVITTSGSIGASASNSFGRCYAGRLQYFATYNTALSQADLYAHWAATGW